MRMLVVFLALTEPASRKAKPACMRSTRQPITARKKSFRLSLSTDRSTSSEEFDVATIVVVGGR